MTPAILSETLKFDGHHLAFRELEYIDQKGVTRNWETVDRRGGTVRGIDDNPAAVFIVAKIVPDNELLLVRQFRPPAGRLMVEFPAGLIDPGESVKKAAVRELSEETGYTGRLLFCTRPGFSSPGLTGESIVLAAMEIDGNAYRETPAVAHPEECESIEVFRVPIEKLPGFLAEQETSGCGIDSKLYTYLSMKRMGF